MNELRGQLFRRWADHWTNSGVRNTTALAVGAIALLGWLLSDRLEILIENLQLRVALLLLMVVVVVLSYFRGADFGPIVVFGFVAFVQMDVSENFLGTKHLFEPVRITDLFIAGCVLAYIIAHGRYRFLYQRRGLRPRMRRRIFWDLLSTLRPSSFAPPSLPPLQTEGVQFVRMVTLLPLWPTLALWVRWLIPFERFLIDFDPLSPGLVLVLATCWTLGGLALLWGIGFGYWRCWRISPLEAELMLNNIVRGDLQHEMDHLCQALDRVGKKKQSRSQNDISQ